MRFEELNAQYRSRTLSFSDAASLLGVLVSTFYRYRQRYDDEGVDAMVWQIVVGLQNK